MLSDVHMQVLSATSCPECARLLIALEKSVSLQSHYAGLLNMWDGGERMKFENAGAWMQRLEKISALAPAVEPKVATPGDISVCGTPDLDYVCIWQLIAIIERHIARMTDNAPGEERK